MCSTALGFRVRRDVSQATIGYQQLLLAKTVRARTLTNASLGQFSYLNGHGPWQLDARDAWCGDCRSRHRGHPTHPCGLRRRIRRRLLRAHRYQQVRHHHELRGVAGVQGRGVGCQPSQLQTARPMISSLSCSLSQGSSSVNRVMHCRHEQGMRVMSVPQNMRSGPNAS